MIKVFEEEIQIRKYSFILHRVDSNQDEVEVAAVPGEAFGPSGYLRFSYALGDEDIVEGIGRVAKLLGEAK